VKVICARKDIYEGVQTAGRAVSSRTSLPILSHLLITAEEDRLRIAATDLEIGMECIVEANVVEQGAMTVPSRVLTEVLAALPESDVSISVDESNTVLVKCATSDFAILGLPPEEFPMLPEVVEEVRVVVERDVLRDAIKKTSFAISQDETKVILTGILMQVNEEDVKFVATDGHRLCVQECVPVESRGIDNAIIPGRAMNEIMRIVPEGPGTVEILVSSTQAMFKVDSSVLISRRIDGQFPNFNKVIPTEFERKLTVPTEHFLQSVRRAAIVARENSNKIILWTEDGKLNLSAESGMVGRAHEEVEVIKEGEDTRMAFNSRYMLDMLSVAETEAIEMELGGEVSPALLRPQGQANYLYVLMPMQLE